MLGFPAQSAVKPVFAGDEDGGITGPARQDLKEILRPVIFSAASGT